MAKEYVEERNGGLYVAGTRISLDSVVYSLRRGHSPAEIQNEYPLLTLTQIQNAADFYSEHREAVDHYLEEKKRIFEASAIPLSEADPGLWALLVTARAATREVDMGEPRAARFVSAYPMAA